MADELLLEDGFKLNLEDGTGQLLLESDTGQTESSGDGSAAVDRRRRR